MDTADFLDVIAAESAALLDAARRGDPAAAVPGCPDWTLADLAWHLAEVQDFWEFVVRTHPAPPEQYADPQRPDGHDAVLAWAVDRSAALQATLADTDPATKVWTWSSGDDVAWVARRMAHEAAAHRVDAERTLGGDHRLEPEFAADGIDEFLTYFLDATSSGAAGPTPIGGSVHLHCTDAEGEWTIRDAAGGGYDIARAHDKGDVALRGPAHDLLRVLWGREPLDTVTVFGDSARAEALLAAATTT